MHSTPCISHSLQDDQISDPVHIIHALPPSSFRYFEQRLRVTEENYREEIALLQLRLVEGALEESVLKTTEFRYASRSVCKNRYMH